jgi:hypothetical protein
LRVETFETVTTVGSPLQSSLVGSIYLHLETINCLAEPYKLGDKPSGTVSPVTN